MVRLIWNMLLNRRLVAAFVLAVVLFTLALDVAALVAPCPYCRVQRAALGISALVMLLTSYNGLLPRYVAAVAGAFGLVVGVSQNFNHIMRMNAGEFDWSALSIGHPWVLSGLAILALVWQLMLVFDVDRTSSRRP